MFRQIRRWIRKMRGVPLFLGSEHPGLYPHQASAAEIAAWYEKTFGFSCAENEASYFLSGAGGGRVEVMKHPAETHCHVAIQVTDFDQAVAALQNKGLTFKEPTITAKGKTIYLQDPDPDGNPVHLVWFAR